jgi:hypothetical protein
MLAPERLKEPPQRYDLMPKGACGVDRTRLMVIRFVWAGVDAAQVDRRELAA